MQIKKNLKMKKKKFLYYYKLSKNIYFLQLLWLVSIDLQRPLARDSHQIRA